MRSPRLYLTITLLLFVTQAFSQAYNISGKIIDANDNTPLVGVSVLLNTGNDTTGNTGAITDIDGNFTIASVAAGAYSIRATYLGYKTLTQTVNVVNADMALGTLKMAAATNQLKTVTITEKAIRAEQLGDTTQFNANSYKTNPDATAEDLVSKMPGVTSDGNGVKVNGETVQQVYVDGKPFFGTDPSAALKNLPAEVIDKIQVFDKMSDQSQFTGFDDGNAQKTMNIVTKKDKRNGVFGKVYGGYGTGERYQGGLNLNMFNGDRRISIMELSNNINQQNFSSEDLLGISGNSGGQGRGGFGRSGSSRGSFGGGGSYGGGNNNFMVGQQGGITTTHAVGLNYSDVWGPKVKVSGSYFFNTSNNVNNTALSRNYVPGTDGTLVYNQHYITNTKNQNHRFNFRFEYVIDSSNSLTITPNLSVQNNDATTNETDTSLLSGALSSIINNRNAANNTGYNFSNNLLFQHKFNKRGRTASININTSVNEKSGDGSYYSLNNYYLDDTATLLDQQYTLYNNGYTLGGNLSYTEPLSKKSQLMMNYNPSLTKTNADKETSDMNSASGAYTDLDTILSNKYDNTYITQRGGLSYRLNDGKLSLTAGANLQYATLQGDQFFPYTFGIERYFTNVLPSVMLNYKYENGKNLRLMYRTNTDAPSITQLQNVLDISNPLLLRTGNPGLKQSYSHNISLRYGLTKSATARNFFVFANATFMKDYIGNATFIPLSDSAYSDNILIKRGSQLTIPVNLNGYVSARSFATYGMPIDVIKSNLNFNGGFTYTRSPGQVNTAINYSNNYVTNAGFVLGSNISEKLDFTLSYSGSYNIVHNTLQTQQDYNYYNHNAAFKINWIFLDGFVLNTNLTNTYYGALSNTSTGAQNYLLWNAYVAYKFLKSKALEARISAFDLLNQNRSVNRTATDIYVENSVTQVLKQYFMFSLTYTIRSFKGTAPRDMQGNNSDRHMHGDGSGGGFQGHP